MNREREEKPDKLEFPSLTPSSIFHLPPPSPPSFLPTARCFPHSTNAPSLYIVHRVLFLSRSFFPPSRLHHRQSLCVSRARCAPPRAASPHPFGAIAFISRLSRHFSLRLFSRTFAPCRLISRYKLVRAARAARNERGNERDLTTIKSSKSEIILHGSAG